MSDLYTKKGYAKTLSAPSFAQPPSISATMNTAGGYRSKNQVRYAAFADIPDVAYGAHNEFDEPSSDLLMNESSDNAADMRILYNNVSYLASFTALPGELGKQVEFSVANGNLVIEYADRAQDFSDKMPVGNHDLIKSAHLEIKTNIQKPLKLSTPSIYAHNDEHYVSNELSGTTQPLAHVVMPMDATNGVASKLVLERTITSSMRQFLKRFPGQTVDTLESLVNDMKNSPNVMVRYSPDGQGVTSAVTMWYNAMVDEHGAPLHPPLQLMGDGLHAFMPKEIYKQCEDLARTEIAKYISLGDVTSKNFSVVIGPLATKTSSDAGLGDFAYHHPGLNPNSMVADPATGDLIRAEDLFAKTPLHIDFRLIVSYKKVNDGTSV